MVIKLYISGISGNKEVKKKQQRVQMILDSKQINYEAIDITEPGKEKDKEFMQQNGKVRESLGKYPLPPQIFNDDDFCGDYEDFDMANEVDELEKFLHIETISKDSETDSKVNGLQELIIETNNLAAENKQNQEVIESEVNGDVKAVPSKNFSSENIAEKVDIPTEEVLAPEQEESSTLENKENDESSVKESEEHAEYSEKYEIEKEAGEEEEEKENVKNAEEDKIESLNEEKSPPLEEKESNDNYEENENEEDENESSQSEKSQED